MLRKHLLKLKIIGFLTLASMSFNTHAEYYLGCSQPAVVVYKARYHYHRHHYKKYSCYHRRVYHHRRSHLRVRVYRVYHPVPVSPCSTQWATGCNCCVGIYQESRPYVTFSPRFVRYGEGYRDYETYDLRTGDDDYKNPDMNYGY